MEKTTAENKTGTMEDLIHLETMFEEFGRQDGMRDGVQSGSLEGRLSGVGRGFELAKEAGFYGGVAEMWLNAAKRGIVELPPRAQKALPTLQAQAQDFPLANSAEPELDPVAALERLRARFKAASASVGPAMVSQKYRPDDAGKPKMNF
ncbi:hypothetical protein HK104_003903 [Borealophlyctis nickersoniae]|nr:hypothetical protein HK104_003903 [Borealophlyctis nickersoniae]